MAIETIRAGLLAQEWLENNIAREDEQEEDESDVVIKDIAAWRPGEGIAPSRQRARRLFVSPVHHASHAQVRHASRASSRLLQYVVNKHNRRIGRGSSVEMRLALDQMWLLATPDEGQERIGVATLLRVSSLLEVLANTHKDLTTRDLPPPSIDPSVAGSVDLFWEGPKASLLVNVPSDGTAPITYFGKRQSGSSVSGKIATHDNDPFQLVCWFQNSD